MKSSKLSTSIVRPVHSLFDRRDFLAWATRGLGGLALTQLLSSSGVLPRSVGAERAVSRLAARPPHHMPRAKAVIWLFMEGGPSHLDLFDPKPTLDRLAGQRVPDSFQLPETSATGSHRMPLVASRRKWKQYGQCGTWVSDWYPRIAEHVDELAVIRSCWADGLNHVGSVRQMNTGSILAGRPALGAWATYGLGTANDNLPAFVVLADDREVRGGPTNWGAGFLPADYQGTLFQKSGPPILNLRPPAGVSDGRQRGRLDFLQSLQRHQLARLPSEDELAARIASYELAFRMQASASDLVDLSFETAATRALYGLDDQATERFGTNCLLARRLVERGVRFVEVYCGSGSGWDGHAKLEENHTKWCRVSDGPIAGLLTDLKQRGLLDETLVVWGGEFGRTPFSDSNTTSVGWENYGRDHNPWGFSMWLAGGGVRRGCTVGATDDIGFRAVDDRCHVHDLHATILHLLGLNHLDLTYLHNGRDERATINAGELFEKVLA